MPITISEWCSAYYHAISKLKAQNGFIVSSDFVSFNFSIEN